MARVSQAGGVERLPGERVEGVTQAWESGSPVPPPGLALEGPLSFLNLSFPVQKVGLMIAVLRWESTEAVHVATCRSKAAK